MSEDRSDKGKSILGAPPKIGKKKTKQKNYCSTNKNSPPKKPQFCHYCGVSGHTLLNCYKWLISQQSNNVSSLGNQNQLQLSLAFLDNFLRRSCFYQTLMVSTLLFIHLDKSSCKRKNLHPSLPSRRKKILSDFFSFLISCMVYGVFWVSLVLMLCLFAYLFVCFCFVLSFFTKKII